MDKASVICTYMYMICVCTYIRAVVSPKHRMCLSSCPTMDDICVRGQYDKLKGSLTKVKVVYDVTYTCNIKPPNIQTQRTKQ